VNLFDNTTIAKEMKKLVENGLCSWQLRQNLYNTNIWNKSS
jgi:hypothetical protein